MKEKILEKTSNLKCKILLINKKGEESALLEQEKNQLRNISKRVLIKGKEKRSKLKLKSIEISCMYD